MWNRFFIRCKLLNLRWRENESKKNKSGFTLLEIMIVVIIVGVLAALALPRLFGTIEYSRSTEAFSAFASIRSSMERCYLEHRDFTGCGLEAGDAEYS